MGCKLFVALQLEVTHQFIERFAGGRMRGFEPPATFGATKTLKTLLLNPHQLPAHGHLCGCPPTSTRLLSRDETFWFATNGSFRSGVLSIAAANRHSVWAWRKMHKKMGEVYMGQFGRSVGHPTYMEVLFERTSDVGGFVWSERNRFKCWSRFVRRDACGTLQNRHVWENSDPV